MKATTSKKTAASAPPLVEPKVSVTLPPTFTARVNQVALRKGKAAADLYRTSTTAALLALVDSGSSLDEISAALAAIEAESANV